MLEFVKKPVFFWSAACFLLFFMLGAADLWTQEWRWADIIWRMQTSHDYWHPNLAGKPYYDKPLLSYWLMAATTQITGLNEWGLRLPSVLSGLLVLFSTMGIGKIIFNQSTARLAGWLLLTSYYFVFWSRIASADMLNVAGMMFALFWYFSRKTKPGFYTYSIFFLILAAACLVKGLVAAVLVALVILPDLIITKTWKRHLNGSFFLSMLLGVVVYLLPFLLAQQHANNDNSLYLVYRENILRFFAPFDHKDPWYSYFLYLPLYLLPWSIFAIFLLLRHGKILLKAKFSNLQQKGFFVAAVVLFMFFTLSGSRRSYYILPLVPLVILWIAAQIQVLQIKKVITRCIAAFYMILLAWFACLQPLYYHYYGLKPLALKLQQQAVALAPWSQWHVVMLATDDRIGFYLQPAKPAISFRSYSDLGDINKILISPVLIVTDAKHEAELKQKMQKEEVKNISIHEGKNKFSIWFVY